jgi:TonB-linked SusC/RagA family outer membrane protein
MRQRAIQTYAWLLLATALSVIIPEGAFSQQVFSGKVMDENKFPLAGVSVTIKGESKGAVTDEAGAFTLSIPGSGTVLVFSFLGYRSQEVKAVTKNLQIQLLPDAKVKAMDEVVVVGFGTQRKVDLTGAVGSITRKDIATRPLTSPDQALAGKMSGVVIANRSGDPAAPIDVRIRGVGTVGSNQPLWVIDGVPIVQTSNISVNTASTTESNPLAGINPSDIESIDVLKDASASAIYGARAANGVIIVTTKRGREGKTAVAYDGYQGFQSVPENKQFDVLGVQDYIALQKELGRDFSSFSSYPAFNWQDAMFQTAHVTNHNLSISGGSKNMNFNVGGGYHEQGGVERAQHFKRLSLKINSDLKVGKYLKFGESALLSSTDRNVQTEDAAFGAATVARNAPYYNGFSATDPTGYNPSNAETRGAGATGNNLLRTTDSRYAEIEVIARKLLANVYGEFEPVKGLKYRLAFGVDYNVGAGKAFGAATPVDFGKGTGTSLLIQERPIELTTNLTHLLTYQRQFGKHDITVLAGEEETNFSYDKLRIQGRDLFNTNIQFPTVASSVASANEADHWALRGYLGRAMYNYDDKYLVTVNFRRDQSSRFSKENRSGNFPSISAGWRLSEEKFFSKLKNGAFSDVKLRGSWGQSGNQFTGQNFAYLPSLQTTIFYVIGSGQTIVRGPAPVIFSNANLKWETSTQVDFGADLSLFDRKLDITFDYFKKTTNDVLLSLPIPYTSGYFLPADANVGQIKNSGFELAANFRNSIGKVNYSIGGNLTTVKNKVVSLGSIKEITSGAGGALTHRTTAGEELGYFYGFKTDGIYQNDKEVSDALPDAFSSGLVPGDIRFVDVNHDGKVDAKDRTKIGKAMPGYYYGFNLNASTGGFDLGVFFQGVGNIQVYNNVRASMEDMRGGNNQLTTIKDRWHGEGTSNVMPRATADDPNGNNRYSDRWIENGAYLRIKNLQLGYTVPRTKLTSWTKELISSARFYIAVQNLATFTSYKGYDPEVTRGASYQKGEFPLANGVDAGGSPQPRIIQLGWQVVFN